MSAGRHKSKIGGRQKPITKGEKEEYYFWRLSRDVGLACDEYQIKKNGYKPTGMREVINSSILIAQSKKKVMGCKREKRGSYRRRRELTNLERDKAEAINANEIRIKAEAFIEQRLGERDCQTVEIKTERKMWTSRPCQPLPSLSSILLHHTAYLAGLALKEVKAEHRDDYMPENGDEQEDATPPLSHT